MAPTPASNRRSVQYTSHVVQMSHIHNLLHTFFDTKPRNPAKEK